MSDSDSEKKAKKDIMRAIKERRKGKGLALLAAWVRADDVAIIKEMESKALREAGEW